MTWIPVKEQMPPLIDTLWVTNGHDVWADSLVEDEDVGSIYLQTEEDYTEVTHWMPYYTPEPPKDSDE